ncbi:hypothetical protein [Streptomyces indicus]|uniref:Hydrogenase expression protein HypF n=1 Tax=Streptomyces indicus TaxID=417292 RepID=A0A1G8WCL6_9ACTN|nr:hypothetical protein [Streptomyces indicus]SDJ76018.1 hypothetical protein SAMN05421806_102381 [Streptomyces indicus]
MPGDGTQLALDAADGAESPALDGIRTGKTGPKHAAPRKSLLTKLQLPANKAMALAAMPTAVFVGMGLMPKPAVADDSAIPFSSGPCVTREDVEAAQEEEKKESASPTPTPSASETGEDSKGEEDTADTEKPGAEPSGEPSPSASASGEDGTADAAEPKAADEPAAEPTPAPSESKNPLDPLGVGDKLEQFGEDVKDFFTPGDEETAAPEPSAEPSAEPSGKPSAEETDKPAADKPAEDEAADKPADKPAEDAADKVTDEADKAADKLKADIEEAADKVGAEVEGLDVPTLDEALKDLPLGEDGKPRFPCAESDPKALADADLEPGIPALPDYPWKLESSMLTLRGLDYHGVVNVKTANGTVKPVLKFTADEVDIKDLHQIVQDPKGGPAAHVNGSKGATSKIRGGTVTMYTESLKGNLFGLIPVEFTPKTPPPLNVPFAFFTNVTVMQAGQFGGTLTVPGFENYVVE